MTRDVGSNFPWAILGVGLSISQDFSTSSWREVDISPDTCLAVHEGSQFRGSGEPAALSLPSFIVPRFNPWREPTLPRVYLMRPREMSLALLLASQTIGQERGPEALATADPIMAQRQGLGFVQTHDAIPCVYASLRPTLMVDMSAPI